MYCSKCGKQLPEGARFCESCGAPVAQKTNIHREPLAPTKEGNSQDIGNVFKQPNIKRAFIGVIGFILVVVLLSVVLPALSRRSSLTIGQSYQGGKIAYIDGTGQHGLIAAPSDQSTGIVWWNGSYTITGATATAIGTGNANTNTIVTSQGAGSYPAKLCADLVLGGYSDWYLPSKDELNQLYLNKTAVGGFASTYYWSSSEYNTSFAWGQYFDGGSRDDLYKDDAAYVRAVRAF